jgi:hypothetical protein
VCWFLAGPPASAGQEADWPDDPGDFDFNAVNEGELVFLERPPEKPVHTHRNRITLTARSLVDGWAALYQCHSRLDPVPATQIVFRPGRVRRLQVEEYTAIGAVRVEGDTVQLEDIRPGARLCLSAESRVVRPDGGGGFAVHNGPFMRGFLDGYYPMHVVLEIGLPPGDWKLVRSEPAAQRGFDVRTTADGVSADAWFSGRLRTEFHFMPSQSEPRQSGSTNANDRQ